MLGTGEFIAVFQIKDSNFSRSVRMKKEVREN